MTALLDETRRLFGPAPRDASERGGPTPPPWMAKNDPLRATYERRAELLANGDVIWGYVVQVNVALFRPGVETSAAHVVYAAGDTEVPLDVLRRAAHAAFEWKGKRVTDPGLARVAQALAAANERHAPFDLPAAVTRGFPVRLGIVMVHRQSLPSMMLSALALPLVANRARDEVAVLPARLWSADLVGAWLALGAGEG